MEATEMLIFSAEEINDSFKCHQQQFHPLLQVIANIFIANITSDMYYRIFLNKFCPRIVFAAYLPTSEMMIALE